MKYALVTGGSRGIGRAVCLKLAEMGYHILINYQSNDTEAEATLQQIREQGSDGELMKFDVTDAAATHAALNGWMEKHPDTYIEVLVNNAGIRRDNLMLWMEQDEWSRVLDISLNGFFNVTQPLLKNMLVKRFGRIINIVSLSGIKGMPGQTNYSAAKGGMEKTDTGRTVRRTRRSSRTGRLPSIGTSLLYHRRSNFHQWRNLYISRR